MRPSPAPRRLHGPYALVSQGALLACLFVACARFGAVYPARPPAITGAPLPEPAPARVVVHVAMTAPALRSALDDAVPRTGEGTFPLLGSERRYRWERESLALSFGRGMVTLETKVHANVGVPVGSLDVPLELRVQAEPIINTDYTVRMQAPEVKVTSTDRRMRIADQMAGVFDLIGQQIRARVREFAYDLRPLLGEAHARLGAPLPFPIGEARGCVELRVLGIEASPTIVADGLEKDFALVVAPSVTLPCGADPTPRPFPALANVSTLVPGPFTVTVPFAARYDELGRAMAMAFTDGKLFFSAEHPKLYLEKPELYESQGQVVLKLHLHGPVHKMGIDAELDGDLFLSGHPQVVDNEIVIPDLEPTIETSNFLLSLKALTDGAKIREQARAALRLDIGERLRCVRGKLSSDLTFGDARACFHAEVDRIQVTGVHAHAAYLRVYAAVTARASALMPCPFARGAD